MKPQVFVALFLVLNNSLFGQKLSKQIEISTYLRCDGYNSFTYPTSPVTNTTVTLKGISWGIQPAIKFPLKYNIFTKFGLGYYKYSFNNIQQYTHLFGTYNNREINYPLGSSRLGYATSKYWYNTLSASVGIEKLFFIKHSLVLVGGFDVVNYYTLSQQYTIVSDIKYRESNNRYLGFSANIHAGLQKKFGKVNIDPTMILPVYSNWEQDKIFPQESNNRSRSKWLRGIGIGITFSYSL